VKLHILYQLGVRSVGLTWNQANLAADGAGEPRGAGLTLFGKEIVEFNNEHQILTDVSHLSDQGIWEVIELAKYPIASHSNARALCNHLRNLTDEQAQAMFAKGGLIHVVYHPPFVKESGEVTISDLVKHIDHFCSLGGVKQIGFGSDLDGITTFITNLEDASKSQNLINELLKYYPEEVVRGFAYQNFLDHRPGIFR
jgi:membrane dipeptidase